MKDEARLSVRPSIIYIRIPVSLQFISINVMLMLFSFGFLLTPYFCVDYLTIDNSIIWPPHLSVTIRYSISVFQCHSFTLDLNITRNFSFSEIATTDNCLSDHLLPSFQLTHFNSPLSFLPIQQPFLSWVSFCFQWFRLDWYFVLDSALLLLLILIGVNSVHQEEISSNFLLFLNSTFLKMPKLVCAMPELCGEKWEVRQVRS